MDSFLEPPTPSDPQAEQTQPASPQSSHDTNTTQSNGNTQNNESGPVKPAKESKPSKRQLAWGHLKSLTFAFLRFILKNNNLALVINIAHHLWNARFLAYKSLDTKWFKDTTSAMHLFFAGLSSIALQKRHRSRDLLTFTILTLASIGQAISHAITKGQKTAVRTIRTNKVLNGTVLAVSSMALSKALQNSGS